MHKKYTHILFDLDGTLVDSSLGIVQSIHFGLDAHKIEYADFDFKRLIGPPLPFGLREFNPDLFADTALLNSVIQKIREHYGIEGVFQSKPYPGITDLLQKLRQQHKRLAVATSKPFVFAEMQLNHHGLSQYFEVIVGSQTELAADKAFIIDQAVKKLTMAFDSVDLKEFVMIGDKVHDVIGAKKNVMDCISVLYGYGGLSEFAQESPTHFAQTILELTELLV